MIQRQLDPSMVLMTFVAAIQMAAWDPIHR
jgi:hypothetical protein